MNVTPSKAGLFPDVKADRSSKKLLDSHSLEAGLAD
jgi:hypothetical protein